MFLATGNPHKVREFAEIAGLEGLEPMPGEIELPPEDADSFEGNALGKARAVHEVTGAEVIADDSGLEVDGLGGDPGVRSARFAGEGATDLENLELLVERLQGRAGPDRRARYVCAIAHVAADGRERVLRATCEGTIIEVARGTGGFGYDPVFVPDDTGPGDDRTMAELEPGEKHSISHRGRAVRMLVEELSRPSG